MLLQEQPLVLQPMQLLPPDPSDTGRIARRTYKPNGPTFEKTKAEDPPAGRLRQFQDIRDARDWAGLEPEAWDAVCDQCGGFADLWQLAQISPEKLRKAIISARIARVDQQGRPAAVAALHGAAPLPSFRALCPVEAAQVGLIWRLAQAIAGEGPVKVSDQNLPEEQHPRVQVEDAQWCHGVLEFLLLLVCSAARVLGSCLPLASQEANLRIQFKRAPGMKSPSTRSSSRKHPSRMPDPGAGSSKGRRSRLAGQSKNQ